MVTQDFTNLPSGTIIFSCTFFQDETLDEQNACIECGKEFCKKNKLTYGDYSIHVMSTSSEKVKSVIIKKNIPKTP